MRGDFELPNSSLPFVQPAERISLNGFSVRKEIMQRIKDQDLSDERQELLPVEIEAPQAEDGMASYEEMRRFYTSLGFKMAAEEDDTPVN